MHRAVIIVSLAVCAGCAHWDSAPAVIGPVATEQPVVVVPMEGCPPDGAVFAAPPVVVQPMIVPGEVPAFPAPAATAPPVMPQAIPPTSRPLDFGLPSEMVGIPGEVADGSILPNPLRVPVTNHEYAWDQIAQVVANYFPIQREQRVRIDGDVWSEGRIETPYRIGATALEPWRGDSVGSFNLWQSTLQTIRRKAMVRVVPEGNSYAIEVQVEKQLEDLPQPEQATAGTARLRTDTALPQRRLAGSQPRPRQPGLDPPRPRRRASSRRCWRRCKPAWEQRRR